MVKPLPGEGIHNLLLRNGLNPKTYYSQFTELNKSKLGKNNSLLSHHSYLLPPSATTITEPLFGETYKLVTLESNELAGAVYYLISGHGGPDPGASGSYINQRLDEDEYAYDITLRLARNLLKKGAMVYIIIQDPNDGIRSDKFLSYDKDETCMGEPIPLDQVARLRQRVDKVNQLYKANQTAAYHRSVSIHLDSRSENKRIDVFFYHHPLSSTGKQMANTLHQEFDKKYKIHQPGRGFSGTISDRNLYELKFTHPVSVFIELGNIQNRLDQQRFIFESNRQALADWLTDGLLKDFKNANTSTKIN